MSHIGRAYASTMLQVPASQNPLYAARATAMIIEAAIVEFVQGRRKKRQMCLHACSHASLYSRFGTRDATICYRESAPGLYSMLELFHRGIISVAYRVSVTAGNILH